jgi:hypothetical protein
MRNQNFTEISSVFGISCSKQASKVLVYRNRKGIYKIKEMRLRIILASVATAVMQKLGL